MSGVVRMGPQDDGGYAVNLKSVQAAELLVSMGLNDDWRFEDAFRQATGKPVICFDHTVGRRFWLLHILKNIVRLRFPSALKFLGYRRFFRNGAEHRLQMIGYEGTGAVSLDRILADHPAQYIFLKVDIEGWEYRILEDVVAHASRFTGMVFEFHDIDLHRDRITSFLDRLKGFALLAINSNNWGGADSAGDPLVVELSLVADRFVDTAGPDAKIWAVPISNTLSKPVIPLAFEQSLPPVAAARA